MMLLYIIPGVLAVVVVWAVFAYNRFVTLKNRMNEAMADIDVQMKRRFDLIPNLVETVKGYAAHEAGTLQKVTDARTALMQAGNKEEQAEAENMLAGTLKSLFAVAESYPDLKANSNFLELQRELSDTENKIQASRRFFNQNVMALNIALESFPSNIIGNMFKFERGELFALSENEQAAREPVKVSF